MRFAASRPGSATPVRLGRQNPRDAAPWRAAHGEPALLGAMPPLRNPRERIYGGFMPDDAAKGATQAFSLH